MDKAKNRLTNFQKLVLDKTKKIPKGKVATYAKIAHSIGRPRAVRAVGNALKNPWAPKIPCHRVVKSNGRVGNYANGINKKIKRLRSEGVKIKKGRVVDFSKINKQPV